MSETCAVQMRADILQAVALVPGKTTRDVADRAGYTERQTLAMLRTLEAEGEVIRGRPLAIVWFPKVVTEAECRRVDVLQTVKLLGAASAFEIAARTGYNATQIGPTLLELVDAGAVICTGKGNTTKWRAA